MYEKQNIAGAAFLMLFFLTSISCKLYDSGDKHTYYSGKWKSSTNVEKWAGFGQFKYTNKINVSFNKAEVLEIFRGNIDIKVSYENRKDSILATYGGLKKDLMGRMLKYPWEEISKKEPIFVLHKISKNRNAFFLEWKGFHSDTENLDAIWARSRVVKHPPGATLEGIYLRPSSEKNGDKDLDLKNSVKGELLSDIILGRKIGLGMSKYEVADKIATRPNESMMSRMLAYKFKATDTELRSIGIEYDRNGVSYIQSRPSKSGETERYKKLIKDLGAKKVSVDKVKDEGVDNLLVLTHKNVAYKLLISESGDSLFRVTPK
jgi:hypothetical protein